MTDRAFDAFRYRDLSDAPDESQQREGLGSTVDPTWDDDRLVDCFDGLLDALPHEYLGDPHWFRLAMKVLARLGEVTTESDALDLVQLQMDMCAVAVATRSFHNAWDPSGPDPEHHLEWRGASEEVTGQIELGRLCERHGVEPEVEITGEQEDRAVVLKSYALARSSGVLQRLADELGVNELFVSMWAAGEGETTFPVPDERWAIVHHPTYPAIDAWGWLSETVEERPRRTDDSGTVGASHESKEAPSATMHRRLRVGERYDPQRRSMEEGVRVRFSPTYAELLVILDSPTGAEVEGYRSEASFAGVLVSEDVLMVAAGFGDLPWIDAPFQAWRMDAESRGIPAGGLEDAINLRTVLVDGGSGRIVTMRVDELSSDLSAVIRVAIFKQLEKEFDDEAAHRQLQRLYEKYSSPEQMVVEAAHALSGPGEPGFLDVEVSYH